MNMLKGKGALYRRRIGDWQGHRSGLVDAGASVMLCDLNADALDVAVRDLGPGAIAASPRFAGEPGRRRHA